MSLQKNQIISLSIDTLSNDGNGIGRYEGQAVFVPFTAVGDALKVKIVKTSNTYAFGIVDQILTPAPGRILPACVFFGKCGGCAFQHITYEAELLAKESFVADAMQRLGDVSLPVLPILPSPENSRYRNKVQYPLTTDETGTVRAGFFAPRSHRVIPCTDCLLQPTLLNEITVAACALFTRFGITTYNEIKHTGLLRHIYLRHAIATDEVMVCLIANGKKLPQSEDFCSALCEAFPQISTIVLNVNTARTNVITGDKCFTLWGSGVIHDTMSGVPVTLNPLSFYQVNTQGANLLYRVAAALADVQPDEVVLDLYCGAGTIGLSMAHRCKKLVGVEIIPQAIENAKQNAEAMGITHAEFLCADAGEAAKKLAAESLAPQVVILDPPRKGCDNETLNAVLSMQPQRIVMISCNPATAARDVQFLQQRGYTPTVIQPVDMFPRTKHVETIVLMSRQPT